MMLAARTRAPVIGLTIVMVACASPTPRAESRRIASGADHTCVVSDDGTARCWGWNFFGQLGSGATPEELGESPRPLTVLGARGPLEAVEQVACGNAHACAVDAVGRVFCWGDNLTGTLGTESEEFFEPTAAEVALAAPASLLAAGGAHTCALLANRSLACWGNNFYGQLGDGSMAHSFVPTLAPSATGYVDLTAGTSHTCAVDQDGRALCWGDNGSGQLGDGTTTWRATPTPVLAEISFSQIGSGLAHSCAVSVDGDVYCWGSNEFGQLGMDGPDDRLRPLRVPGLPPVGVVAAGLRHTCAVSTGGSVFCWGKNTSRQAAPLDVDTITAPQHVEMGAPVAQLALGATHTCAMTIDDTVLCWGDGGRGQLGNDVDASASPLHVAHSNSE